MAARATPLPRSAFRQFLAIPTRWHDNDIYGHVNNVIYYAYFDTAVNHFLVDRGILEVGVSTIVGIVVETSCTFFESIAFPETIDVGIAVEHLGRSSVRYRIGIFREGKDTAAAQGRFTHVIVDRATMRPTAMPEAHRAVFETILAPAEEA